MPLLRADAPFNHPDWLFELKYDGFRALVEVRGHVCTLNSRRGHPFTKFKLLAEEIVYSVRAMNCVLDGEITCLGVDGRSNFYDLLFRRGWPYFLAFDLLSVDGEDLRDRPLVERKRRLRAIMPRVESWLVYVDDLPERGVDLFRLARERDLEGIVAKWKHGTYDSTGGTTSWLKVRNPTYSQWTGRRELFEKRRDRRQERRRSWRAPALAPKLAHVLTTR